MKFSDTLIPWKSISNEKGNPNLHNHNKFPKILRNRYVELAIRNPEFEQSILEIHKRVMEHSNLKEKAAITDVIDKINKGELEYDDLRKIERISKNSYKYLFSISPDCVPRSTNKTIVLSLLVLVGLIILRIAYTVKNSSTLLLFISIINVIASVYTFINWPLEVTCIIEKWLQKNNIQSNTCDKMIREVSKKLWFITAILILALIVWLIACYLCSIYEIGTDIVLIAALGISVLNNHIVKLLAMHFEKCIYYDV